MALILKSLSVILATATIICGEEIKKSEKRGIADFGSGFSSTKLEGSGIKISTDFGKELTLEEYRQNGYSFGNDNNANNKFADDISKHFHFNKEQFPDISQYNNIPEPNLNIGTQGNHAIQGIQGNIENKGFQISQNIANNNQFGNFGNFGVSNHGNNNGETSSVNYLTQNIPIPVPQPYPVIVNRPEAVLLPQPISYPASQPIYNPLPVPQRQEIQVPVPQQYQDSVAQSIPANGLHTDTSQASQPDFNVNVNANYQIQNNGAYTGQEQSGYEQRNSGNVLQRELNSVASALSGNNQLVQTNQIPQPLLTNTQQGFHSNEQQYSNPQGIQINEDRASLSRHFAGVELQGGFQPSNYPSQGEATAGHQYLTGTLPNQTQQSAVHSALAGQNQGLYTGGVPSSNYQQNVQLIVGHQQGVQAPEGHNIVANPSHQIQSPESLHHVQPEASPLEAGKYNLLGGLFGQQALEHIQQIISKTGTLNGGHVQPTG